MDFRKLGWMLVLLSLLLGGVACYYALVPYLDRWVEADAIQEAIRAGYPTDKYISVKASFALAESRLFMFGWTAGIACFLGLALIASSKKRAE